MVWKLETKKVVKIKNKIFSALTFNDLVFLRRFISKHWYKCLYMLLWFDNVEILSKT